MGLKTKKNLNFEVNFSLSCAFRAQNTSEGTLGDNFEIKIPGNIFINIFKLTIGDFFNETLRNLSSQKSDIHVLIFK